MDHESEAARDTALVDQFTRLRDGDRFWYRRDLRGKALGVVEEATLASVIARNSSIEDLHGDAFLGNGCL